MALARELRTEVQEPACLAHDIFKRRLHPSGLRLRTPCIDAKATACDLGRGRAGSCAGRVVRHRRAASVHRRGTLLSRAKGPTAARAQKASLLFNEQGRHPHELPADRGGIAQHWRPRSSVHSLAGLLALKSATVAELVTWWANMIECRVYCIRRVLCCVLHRRHCMPCAVCYVRSAASELGKRGGWASAGARRRSAPPASEKPPQFSTRSDFFRLACAILHFGLAQDGRFAGQ